MKTIKFNITGTSLKIYDNGLYMYLNNVDKVLIKPYIWISYNEYNFTTTDTIEHFVFG